MLFFYIHASRLSLLDPGRGANSAPAVTRWDRTLVPADVTEVGGALQTRGAVYPRMDADAAPGLSRVS
jgi:hypothetical protein